MPSDKYRPATIERQGIFSEAARKKKDKKEESTPAERRPGETSPKLRRRMLDPLADIFSEKGVEMFDKSVASIQASLTQIFEDGIGELGEVIKQKLGEYGYEESVDHFRPWMKDVVHDIFGPGMEEVLNSLDGLVSTLSVQYTEEDVPGSGDLLGSEIPEIPMDEVKEVTDIENEEDAAAPEEEEAEVTLGEEAEATAATTRLSRKFHPKKQVQSVFARSKQLYNLRTAAAQRISELNALSNSKK